MEKIIINGVEFCDFGSNNYTNGMHMITCYPMPENMVQDVLDGKYENVYLNPSARCGEEFFGVLGTAEQYAEFKERQQDSQIASRVIATIGGIDAMTSTPIETLRKVERDIRSTYKNWWE